MADPKGEPMSLCSVQGPKNAMHDGPTVVAFSTRATVSAHWTICTLSSRFSKSGRGRLHGFRWHDATDYKSCSPEAALSARDQILGRGDGMTAQFALIKTYGRDFAPYTRRITKPVAGSVLVAVDNVTNAAANHVIDTVNGTVTFQPGHIPAVGQMISAAFQFDVPVRFDTDKLEINLSGFRSGAIPAIPLIEIRV